mmetsp:Transcript_2347/g.7032  ORF Transcript_2347/g.7032 Transcript_2347/m.7032 type:complete len:202 (+) Transcript_2347:828-1433(+)
MKPLGQRSHAKLRQSSKRCDCVDGRWPLLDLFQAVFIRHDDAVHDSTRAESEVKRVQVLLGVGLTGRPNSTCDNNVSEVQLNHRSKWVTICVRGLFGSIGAAHPDDEVMVVCHRRDIFQQAPLADCAGTQHVHSTVHVVVERGARFTVLAIGVPRHVSSHGEPIEASTAAVHQYYVRVTDSVHAVPREVQVHEPIVVEVCG